MTRKRVAVVTALLIAALAGLGAWRITRRAPSTARSAPVAPSAPSNVPSASAGAFPPPAQDLPPDRFYERVDGAEAVLRSLGCRRLMVWRLDDPAADLEILAFDSPDGAAKALARDAGPDRTHDVPGDEGWANGQVVYFRRGAVYVRIITDAPGDERVLLAEARRVDRALADGSIRP